MLHKHSGVTQWTDRVIDWPGVTAPLPVTPLHTMLRWAIAFFVIALIAAVFGFTGIAAASAGIAKIIFFVAFAIFLLALIANLFRTSTV